VAAYVVKPVKRERLLATLRAVVRGDDAFDRKTLSGGRVEAVPEVTMGSLKILLAEDNVVNQKVAIALLRKLNQTATVAADGRQVLEMVNGGGFDVILMDCQMPELDGYATTHQIRLEEADGTYGRRVPHFIVALTANAMVGDRERCLEAGMDDFLTKPVELTTLEAALRRAVAFRQTALGPMPLPPVSGGGAATVESVRTETAPEGVSAIETEAAAVPVLDPDTVNLLVVPGDASSLTELVDLFRSDGGARLAALQASSVTGDVRALMAAAHTLKGSAGNLGGRRLAMLVGRLESAAKSGDLALVRTVLPQVEKAYEAFVKALAEHQP
jgi:CheY-like chemotaxis protein/HPt (histidine-containing phosphotransfer) domain-containing protein